MKENEAEIIKSQIRDCAYSLGFTKVGFTLCKPHVEERERVSAWFSEEQAGPLNYLSVEKILDPCNALPCAKTAAVVFFPYARPNAIPGQVAGSLKLSRYLWGPDYHTIIKSRLFHLLEYIKTVVPKAIGRVCVDTSPIMERKLASLAGLGWQGKNTLLIAGKQGSWGFLGVLLLDFEIEPDPPFEGDRCGTCSRCIDSCPTNALKPFRLDCRRCLTTWNVERCDKPGESISQAIADTGWIAGCDICQEVCPWNSSPGWGDPEIWGRSPYLHTKPAKELRVTSSQWKKITSGTALRRISFRHWMSNLEQAMGNKKN